MLKTTRLLAALIFCAFASSANAAYTGLTWGLDRTSDPYKIGINLNGVWYEFANISSLGIVTPRIDLTGYVKANGVGAYPTASPTIPSTDILFAYADSGALSTNVSFILKAMPLSAGGFSGVDPTGASDSTVGLQNWINAACLSKREAYLPGGTYRATALTVACSDINIRGAGQGVSILDPLSTTGNFLTIGQAGTTLSRITVRDFSVMPRVTRTSGANIYVIDTNTFSLENVLSYGGYDGVAIDNTTGVNRSYATVFHNFSISNASNVGLVVGRQSDNLYLPADVFLNNGQINGNKDGIAMYSVSGLSASLVDMVSNTNSAWTMGPGSTQIISFIRFHDVKGDTSGSIACNIGGTGKIADVILSDVWCSSSGGAANLSVSNANLQGLTIIGGDIINSQQTGALILSGNDIDFYGVNICYNSQATLGASHGIYFGPSVGRHSVRHSRVGNCGVFKALGAPNKQGYGIFDDANSLGSDISDNDLSGNATGPLASYSTGAVTRWGNAPSSVASVVANDAAFNLHVLNGSGIPAVSACGTSPAVAANSNNASGGFTTGTGTPTACTITFANAYPTAAFCTVSPVNAAAVGTSVRISAQSASAFTITLGAGTDSAQYQYVCGGK